MKIEAEHSNKYNVPILAKGMELLELLGKYDSGLTLQEMCNCLHYPKTSLYRIAVTFLEMGYLTKDEDSSKYVLSRKIFHLGLTALGEANILERAIEPMKRLRDDVKESVMLGTLEGSRAVLLQQVLGAHDFTFMLRPGAHLCLHASAPGKVLIAYQKEEVKQQLLKDIEFTRFNDNTITHPEKFQDELQKVLSNGYGVDMEEEISGVYCIGAPIFKQDGEIVACVWVSGPKGRMTVEVFPNMVKKVCSCAKTISSKLGYRA